MVPSEEDVFKTSKTDGLTLNCIRLEGKVERDKFLIKISAKYDLRSPELHILQGWVIIEES